MTRESSKWRYAREVTSKTYAAAVLMILKLETIGETPRPKQAIEMRSSHNVSLKTYYQDEG